MSNTDPQLEFNFASLRPFVEVPRDKRGYIDQRELQFEGVFRRGDLHPQFKGLVFRGNHQGAQRWASSLTKPREKTKRRSDNLRTVVLKKAKANPTPAKRYCWLFRCSVKNRTLKAQTHLKTLKRHMPHPTMLGLFFVKHSPSGTEVWRTADEIADRADYMTALYRVKHYPTTECEAQNWQDTAQARRQEKIKNNIRLHKAASRSLYDLYRLCKNLTLCSRGSGSTEVFEVDHIWPITHEKFCGLHAPWNLQILEASENRRKSNKPPLPC